jgi:hypothetical protein
MHFLAYGKKIKMRASGLKSRLPVFHRFFAGFLQFAKNFAAITKKAVYLCCEIHRANC